MSNAQNQGPGRGEVWLTNFDPTIGAEIRKTRPAVVMSADPLGKLPIKVVVPVTEWQAAFANNEWHVRLDPGAGTGLTKVSAADVLQIRGMDVRRMVRRLGALNPAVVAEIAAAIAGVVRYVP